MSGRHMKQCLRNRAFAVWVVLLVLAVGRLIAQTVYTGSITGSVKDSTGAVIPNATVVVTNTATGVKTTVTTTSVGDYTVPNLIPGQYSVLAEAPGFAKEEVTGITLVVDQQARVNLVLKPGSARAPRLRSPRMLSNSIPIRRPSPNLSVRSRSPICRSTGAISSICSLSGQARSRSAANSRVTPARATPSASTDRPAGVQHLPARRHPEHRSDGQRPVYRPLHRRHRAIQGAE